VPRFLRRLLHRLVWPDAVTHEHAERVVVHEWFARLGGSDKVAVHLTSVADAEVVYTFACDDALVQRLGVPAPVVTWRFGRAVGRLDSLHLVLPLMPLVWWALDLSAARLVVTSAHSCANAVVARDARRLSYVHTPMRYARDWRLEQGRVGRSLRWLLPMVAAVFRRLDRRWSRRVDVFVANSSFVAGRIRHAYGRDATVVHPPIDVARFRPPADPVDRASAPFIAAGRFVAYKQVRLAVEAARRAGARLVLAGGGPDLDRLRENGALGPEVATISQPGDDELAALLGSAKALLMPGVEDFGMLVVEAQACGTPVIARRGGGALDTVLPGHTGILVDGDDPAVWAEALAAFDPGGFDPTALRAHAERFDATHFERAIASLVDEMMTDRP
jgi:glycosyltransferase involved in cell wall biosynthesis